MAKFVSLYTGIMCLMPREVDQLDRVENLDVVRETNVIYDIWDFCSVLVRTWCDYPIVCWVIKSVCY